MVRGIPDTRVTVEDVIIAGESVVGRYNYRGRHAGTLLGVPPSGAEVTMRSIDIWRVRDGLFVEHWDELSTLEVF
jgi:predicted ester cyclase